MQAANEAVLDNADETFQARHRHDLPINPLPHDRAVAADIVAAADASRADQADTGRGAGITGDVAFWGKPMTSARVEVYRL